MESSVVKEEDFSAQSPREDSGPYKVPESRAAGRPHNLGWLDILGDEEITGGESGGTGGNVNVEFESDNWRESGQSGSNNVLAK